MAGAGGWRDAFGGRAVFAWGEISMRVGKNPAKFVDQVAQPARITVAVITYIPFLGGYYAESLDVLKVCLGSIWQNTDLPYDLLVFDNASCAEVRRYLGEVHEQGKIQFLWLSDKNIGKAGAWNMIFGGAPGEIIAYADSDVYFYPGWLSALVGLLEKFPKVGMVTGMPLSGCEVHCSSTLEWAKHNPQVRFEEGRLLPWADYWKHNQSLGKNEREALEAYQSHQDVLMTFNGTSVYIGAGHFQFVAYRKVLQEILPLPSKRPMGQVMALDQAMNERGYLRICSPEWYVQHLGNTLGEFTNHDNLPRRKSSTPGKGWVWKFPLLRRIVFWIYHQSFNLLYRRGD